MVKDTENKDKINVSCQIPLSLHEELMEFCHTHQLKKSDVLRQALIREIQGGRDWQIMRQCEQLIDIKLQQLPQVIAIPSQRLRKID